MYSSVFVGLIDAALCRGACMSVRPSSSVLAVVRSNELDQVTFNLVSDHFQNVGQVLSFC